MSVIGKTTLIETIPIAKNNPFYGEYFKRNTFTEEYIMEKFQDVACPNQGIEVGFKHGNATYVLQANKYAFIDKSNDTGQGSLGTNRYFAYSMQRSSRTTVTRIMPGNFSCAEMSRQTSPASSAAAWSPTTEGSTTMRRSRPACTA